MCKTTESVEQKFYILITDKNDEGEVIRHKFEEVVGEMVDVGEGVQAFLTNGDKPEEGAAFWRDGRWRIVDLMTGARLSYTADSPQDALDDAILNLSEHADEYANKQADFVAYYGTSPAIEVDIIQLPKDPEIKACEGRRK